MKCTNLQCRTDNSEAASECWKCGQLLRTISKRAFWSPIFEKSLSGLFLALFLFLNLGGIYFAFSRHGAGHGIIAVLVPPYAWYRAISPLWDTPAWVEAARDKVETVAYVILHGQSPDPKLRTEMAERIPALERLYKKQSKKFRDELNESVTAFIDLVDIIAHDAVDEILRTGTLTVEKNLLVHRHPTLYKLAARFEGLRAALDATMLGRSHE